MGFRFQKRIKLFPGVSLNLSKGGVSVSTGVRGARVSIGTKGVRGTLGLPGTGMSYSKGKSWKSLTGKSTSAPSRVSSSALRSQASDKQKLNLGFLKRLFLSADEKHFVDGLDAYLRGDVRSACRELEQAGTNADALFTLGFIELEAGDFEAAENHLKKARPADLGKFYGKYELALTLDLAITEYAGVKVQPNAYALRLGLVETAQGLGRASEALDILRNMIADYPDDLSVLLSTAEIVVQEFPEDRNWLEWLLSNLTSITNETNVHANLLLYKAQAQAALALYEPAVATLTALMRKKAARDPELLLQMRYTRALCYRELGETEKYEKDIEAVKAEQPDFDMEDLTP